MATRKTHRKTGGSMHHPMEETPMEMNKKRGGVARHRTKSVCKKDGGHVEYHHVVPKDAGHVEYGHVVPKDRTEGMEAKKKGGSVNFIKNAIKRPGALREALHAKPGKKIPEARLERATHSRNPTLKKEAVLAETLRGFEHHKKGGCARRPRSGNR